MALVKDISEIQKYIKVNLSTKGTTLIPYVNKAQDKYIRPYLGDALLDELDEWYNETSPPTNQDLARLLPYVQDPLAQFAYLMASADLDIQTGETGFTVLNTQNAVPASTDRVRRFNENRKNLGYDGIERLLRFLEKNVDTYESWKESTGYTIYTDLFITTAEKFDQLVNIDKSRLQFYAMKQEMQNIEQLIIYPAISEELSKSIKEEAAENDLSDPNKKILPLLQRAVANLVAARFFPDKTPLESTGEHYLAEVKLIIDQTPDDYPLYKASSIYEANRQLKLYENSEDKGFFLFGGG
jgi:hypothetical protein